MHHSHYGMQRESGLIGMIRYICISNKKQVIFSCESEIEISIDTCQYCIKTRVLSHKKRTIVVYLKNKLKE